MSGRIGSMRQTLRWVALVAAALATIGCDRATKHVATALLAGEPDRSYLADTVRLGYAENTGGFLSLGADWPKARESPCSRWRLGSHCWRSWWSRFEIGW